MKKLFIGIDVSKLSIDVAYCLEGKPVYLKQYANEEKGFIKLCSNLEKLTKIKFTEWFVCFENTGVYSKLLLSFLCKKDIACREENPLFLSRSIGISRGKNDKIDAMQICRYAYEKRDIIKPSQPLEEDIAKLRKLLSRRELLKKQKVALTVSLKDQKKVVAQELFEFLEEQNQKLIDLYKQGIKEIENKIKEIIKANESMLKNATLAKSIKGIGPIISSFLIAFTDNFTSIIDGRKFASYSGIAPFPHQSGSSIKRKDKVSYYSNKRFKTLLSNGARSAIQTDSETKLYYDRKIKEGKSPGKVINNVKNKLIHRVFAVVKRGTPYVEYYKYLNA